MEPRSRLMQVGWEQGGYWVGLVTKVWMSSNEPKLMSKRKFFYNSCYICLCGAILMACELWKIMLIEWYGYWKV